MKPFGDISDWLVELAGKGPWKCRCGIKVDHPGVCDACAEKIEREQADKPLITLSETVPVRFRACAFGHESLAWMRGIMLENGRRAADLISKGQRTSVVIVGARGTGKTTLACAILRDIASRGGSAGWRCRFIPALKLGAARGEYGMPSQLETLAIGASCLLLDDLGQENESDQIRMREVVHARHDDMHPTIITSGFSAPVLQARYANGMDRRMFEGALIIDTGGL